MLARQRLKKEFEEYCLSYSKHFLKQGAFSLYHSKELDYFVKKSYEGVLLEFFEEFLPTDIPICIIATKAYSDFKLCANESLGLLFVYKDIKAFHIKPMIKGMIALLNDIGLHLEYQICEASGIMSKYKELEILSTRYICGSKTLFKNAKEDIKRLLILHRDDFASKIFEYFNSQPFVPFIKQEFDIKKDFGGLNDYANLNALLALFKDSPKNYALEFISEKELSELRLAMDFLLSLKSAMNIQSKKDNDIFLMANANELSALMQKKDKKNLQASQSLLQKAMSCMHTIGIFTRFLLSKIKQKHYKQDLQSFEKCGNFLLYKGVIYLDESFKFESLKAFLQALNALEDKYLDFDIGISFYLRQMKISKKDIENALLDFKNILYRQHSFSLLKLLLDSGLLKDLLKAFALLRFLPDEESVYSRDENAFLILGEFERSKDEQILKLNAEEKLVLKLSIIMSASNEENEISRANIYRSLCLKLDISSSYTEWGLKFFKYFFVMKELIEKEDIYNEIIISSLISKLENARNLKLLASLSFISAKALGENSHFYYKSLDKLLLNSLAGFENAEFLDESTRRVKKELTLKRTKVFLELDTRMQDKILHIASNLFIIKNSFENIVEIAKIADKEDFKLWLDNEKNLILELVAKSSKLDLSNILNTLSAFNLVFMSFFSLFDDKVYLKFEYSNIISDEQKNTLKDLLEKNLQSHKKSLKKALIKKDELKFDLNYSKTYAKLNLNTKDQQGLMAYVMSVFNEFKLTLSAAKIQTIRRRTRNTFYFQKTKALIENEAKIITILTGE